MCIRDRTYIQSKYEIEITILLFHPNLSSTVETIPITVYQFLKYRPIYRDRFEFKYVPTECVTKYSI